MKKKWLKIDVTRLSNADREELKRIAEQFVKDHVPNVSPADAPSPECEPGNPNC